MISFVVQLIAVNCRKLRFDLELWSGWHIGSMPSLVRRGCGLRLCSALDKRKQGSTKAEHLLIRKHRN